MRNVLLFFFLGVVLCCCYQPSKRFSANSSKVLLPRVFIQPFASIDNAYIEYLKTHIAGFYKIEIIVLPPVTLPGNAFYIPRNRYIADSLLPFLKSGSKGPHEYVLGVTSQDISTKNGDIANWGVMGLGLQPGNACVISTFRIKTNAENKQLLFQRFLKVALHELGHNFGLQHCPNQHCIMVDAEGKNKLDGEENLCKNCIKLLQKKGIL